MTHWQDVVEAALIGIERRPFKTSMQDSPLDDVLARLDTADSERALLSAAAVVLLYQRAGRLPATDAQPLPQQSDPEDQPRCTLRAGQRLALMLDGQYAEVLPEWLAALASARQRVPEESLPALLDLGKTQPDLRESIVPVLGKRGVWLAAQNADWEYALGDEDESIWQTGGRAGRLRFLQQLRRRDPNHARELVAATWAEDAPDDRAAFLLAFVVGLSMADEPFLEDALADRRKDVRRTAADLLAQLPESRLCRRMIDRVRPLLRLTKGRKPRIEITLPETCDETMARDGVESKPPQGTGQKEWWLEQMLGAVPPIIWRQAWGKTPAELIQAADRSEWRRMLLHGWAVAAQRQRDQDWIEALLAEFLARDELTQALHPFAALSEARQEALILHALRTDPSLDPSQSTRHLLQACRHVWSIDLSRAVLASLHRHALHSDSLQHTAWSIPLAEISRYLHPLLAVEAESHLSEAARSVSPAADAIDRFLTLLRFRYDMLKEINP